MILVVAWLLGGLVLGALFIPGVIRVLGKGLVLKKFFGDLNFILGQVTSGGSALVYRDTRAELCPFDADKKKLFIDNRWVDCDVDTVYRLGWKDFAITYEKSPGVFGRYLVNHDPDDDADSDDESAVLLNEEAGGYPLFSRYLNKHDGFVIHAVRYLKSIGRGGTRLINRSEEEALKKHSGDGQMAQLWLMGTVLVTMVVMFALTWFMLGG